MDERAVAPAVNAHGAVSLPERAGKAARLRSLVRAAVGLQGISQALCERDREGLALLADGSHWRASPPALKIVDNAHPLFG